jgi:thiamine-phosphate pyrophosphorylase
VTASPPVWRLPPILVLTDATLTAGRPLTEVIAAAVGGGARAVLLREKHLPRSERSALAGQLTAILAPVGGRLLIASDPTICADGLHLAAADPVPDPLPPLLGRSCHNAEDLVRAAAEGCTYATLSPVFLTASKPGYGPALGPVSLGGHPLPVWALGGITAANARSCVEAGASGVAVMGSVMRAGDPALVVADLIAAIGATPPAEQRPVS